MSEPLLHLTTAPAGWYVVLHKPTGRPVAWSRRRTLLVDWLRDSSLSYTEDSD